jgi:hypothetical protein
VTADEVDGFMAAASKSLDAEPEWRDGNRVGEKRCSIPVAVDGSQSPVSLEMTVRMAEPDYLMALLLVSKRVICRLCTTTGHFDRELGEIVDDSHFHSWAANRPAGQALPKRLKRYVRLPDGVANKDAALAWFLNENRIDSPSWMPGSWPLRGTLL